MDIYAEVTSRIISQMEQGIIPWQKPWIASGHAISHSTGKPYSILNAVYRELLWFDRCQALSYMQNQSNRQREER